MSAAVLSLVAWAAAWFVLVRATQPGPSIPWASEIAYRDGRQCFTPVYDWSGSAPERCVFPEDHYGECSLSGLVEAPRRRRVLVELVDPWGVS